MAATLYQVTSEWDATARFTATEETAIKINNGARNHAAKLAWTITSDDNEPSIPPHAANIISIYGTDRLTLADGERLWLAWAEGVPYGPASIEV